MSGERSRTASVPEALAGIDEVAEESYYWKERRTRISLWSVISNPGRATGDVRVRVKRWKEFRTYDKVCIVKEFQSFRSPVQHGRSESNDIRHRDPSYVHFRTRISASSLEKVQSRRWTYRKRSKLANYRKSRKRWVIQRESSCAGNVREFSVRVGREKEWVKRESTSAISFPATKRVSADCQAFESAQIPTR